MLRKGVKPGAKEVPIQRVREYHVYDPNVSELARAPVITKEDGKRVVLLTKAQAQYFIDQAIIGETPHAELSDAHHGLLEQFSGGRIKPPGAEDEPEAGSGTTKPATAPPSLPAFKKNEPVGSSGQI